ncbi:general secretion pathway protein GspJ [Limnohabitans sp. TS-CS-82]|uniref:PulJ/GspJ family protein n=1 Tax=Limnohabitans sp. TS-CS-82 TaxID=2094193 RepID=UPI000CF220A8|nr:prepilin-type N-terminal cleavage/methylation domain-containing protein [Limnohabitans sp. TS-CS-82]PQA84759.1 general secretion pathway protein GspJ [Limnohabitans sp. TS-CS-82]
MTNAKGQRGFTLIELLIAITLMAVLAGLSWRGLDSLMRSRDITQVQVDKTAVLQTVLAQWQADLNAVQPVPSITDAGVLWDGRTLRLTRRATAWRADGADAGLWVVAWTLRGNQWLRWQSAPLQTRAALQQAWANAERWGQNPSADDAAFETSLIPLDTWQLTYFRGNAWTNPLSSAGNSDTNNNAVGGTPQTNSTGQGALPDAIRLQIDLPASTGVRGRITLNWVRPNFSNTKT